MSKPDWTKYRGRGIRLQRELYGIPGQATSITVSTQNRRPAFADEGFATTCVHDLATASTRANIAVFAYCFMPDHLHLVVMTERETDLVAFVQRYKSWTTRRAWEFGFTGKLWQRSFYDHILRNDEDVDRHVRYLIENPVRSGLVDDWREYPHTGSLVYDLHRFDW